MTRRATLLACALMVGLPGLGLAVPPESTACGYLLSYDRVCVQAVVHGRSLGCVTRSVDDGNNTTSQRTVCTASFRIVVNGTAWPIPGQVRAEVDFGGTAATCEAMPDCTIDNLTQLVELTDPAPGAVATMFVHAIAQQPTSIVLPLAGSRTPALLSVDVWAEGRVRFD